MKDNLPLPGRGNRRSSVIPPNNRYLTSLKQAVLFQTLPHVALVLTAIAYIFCAGLVFQLLDDGPSDAQTAENQTRAKVSAAANEMNDQLREVMRRLRTASNDTLSGFSQKQLFLDAGKEIFAEYVVKIAEISKEKQNYARTGLGKYLFFATTTLSSIGYGSDAPKSRNGRWFCIAYCLIGLPLMMITLADLAKFLSEFLLLFYLKYRHIKSDVEEFFRRTTSRVLRRKSFSALHASSHHKDVCFNLNTWEDEDIAEFLWSNLETTEFVEVPVVLAFAVILGYAALGAYFFHWSEHWPPFDSFYFAVTSILSIGFGDFVPAHPVYLNFALVYVFGGIIVTTMCIDAAAYRYIQKLYQFARHLGQPDDMTWLKRVQEARMRRDAVKSLFTTFAFLPLFNARGLPSKRDSSASELDVLNRPLETFYKVVSNENAAGIPVIAKLTVTNVTAHSVFLEWACSETTPNECLEFSLEYRAKHIRGRQPVVVIRNLRSFEFEVKWLKSFTLYEFVLYASNVYGRSSPLAILQYTEPETVPQNVQAELVQAADESGSVKIQWEPPCKNKSMDRKYHIYYSENTEQPFERWQRIYVEKQRSAVLEDLKPGVNYSFSVSAVHNSGLAVLSRIVTLSIPCIATVGIQNAVDFPADQENRLSLQPPELFTLGEREEDSDECCRPLIICRSSTASATTPTITIPFDQPFDAPI